MPEPTVGLYTSIPVKVRNKMNRICKAEGMSKAQYISGLIVADIEKRDAKQRKEKTDGK